MANSKTEKVVVIGFFADKNGKPYPIGKAISVKSATAAIGIDAGVFQTPDNYEAAVAPSIAAGFVSQERFDALAEELAETKKSAAANAAIVEKLQPALIAANLTVDDVVQELTKSKSA